MGYDLNRFAKEVDEEFLCPICTMVLENGVQSQHCEHTYCDACIKEWLSINKICPIDRKKLSLEYIKPIPRALKNLIMKLEIKCDFGCEAVIKLEDSDHHRNSCLFDPSLKITCNKECGLEMTQKEYRSHSCLSKLASLVVAQQKQITAQETRISYLESERRKHCWYSVNGLSINYGTIQCNNRGFGAFKYGIAQNHSPLSEYNFYFEIEVQEMGDTGVKEINLGLSHYCLKQYNSSRAVPKNIYYNGNVGFVYIFVVSGQQSFQLGSVPKWSKGDKIGCGLKFGKQVDLVNNPSVVYFTRNNKTVFRKSVNLEEFGLCPTLCTNSVGAKVIVTSI